MKELLHSENVAVSQQPPSESEGEREGIALKKKFSSVV